MHRNGKRIRRSRRLPFRLCHYPFAYCFSPLGISFESNMNLKTVKPPPLPVLPPPSSLEGLFFFLPTSLWCFCPSDSALLLYSSFHFTPPTQGFTFDCVNIALSRPVGSGLFCAFFFSLLRLPVTFTNSIRHQAGSQRWEGVGHAL